MVNRLARFILAATAVLFFFTQASAQLQSCPANINFAAGDLSFWAARTGLKNGATISYPAPNTGVSTIPEYTISTPGIKVITASTQDLFGNFPTIPTINGYSYNYSIQLGSSSTSWDLHSSSPNPGGFTRAITYTINVPAGSATVPYTMTYAYAMVLENGTHNSSEQPLFKATLATQDSVVICASPQYYLPTFNNAGGGSGGGSGGTGATLDTAAALANGFSLSPVLFLSHSGQQGNNGVLLQDVWTKGWTEVTFDLSPYRGKQVTLTFETDNCTPGAHFAYAYVALRNTCAGLEISGNPVACTGSTFTYSIPALAGAVYNWTVPAGWTINAGANTNIITVTAGANGGNIIANEINGCANLKDTLAVTTVPATVPGQVITDNTVCSGLNSSSLSLAGQTGNVLSWLSSTDGVTWTNIANTADVYTALNLTTTTQYRARVQNGASCKIDTSAAAVITVNPKSVGGVLDPADMTVCANQNSNNLIRLSGNTGAVVNWQVSYDNINWNNFAPALTDSSYDVNNITGNTWYRTVVKSGVCPADTSSAAVIHFVNTPFPDGAISPDNVTICYGRSITLNANISIGTSYSWSPTNTLSNYQNGTIPSLPYAISALAAPKSNTNYVLSILNAGCPNPFTDTFHIGVTQPIVVFAGNDTAIVANQPLQLQATVNDPNANHFSWTPINGLSATDIINPVATLGAEIDYITYLLRATDPNGCFGEDDIKVTVFKTGPDMFVPSAFTPNGDGRNDNLYPICVGIKELKFFRIFNRWGQLVFSTSQIGKGWDGRINGVQQATGNFVFMAQAIDYTGKSIFKKGNVVLIR